VSFQAEVIVIPSGVSLAATHVRWAALLGAAAFAATGLYAWSLSFGWLFAALVAAPACLAARVDLVSRRLPDHLLLISLVPTLVATVAESTTIGAPQAVGAVVLGMLAMGLGPFVMHTVAPGSMGFGDVKMTLVLGAALGTWAPVLGVPALAGASLIAVVESLIRRRSAIAFGPSLVAGFVIAALFASPIVSRLGGMSWGWTRW